MIDLFRELTEVVAALDGAGIPYALVGGLAYSIWVEADVIIQLKRGRMSAKDRSDIEGLESILNSEAPE